MVRSFALLPLPTMSRNLFGLLRRHPIWAGASDRTLASVSEGSRVLDRAAGQVFVIEGDPATAIHLLIEGAARVFYPPRKGGAEATANLIVAPGGFGDIACVMRTPYTASVQAVTPARAIAVDAQVYFTALQQDARASFRQYWDVARRFAGAAQMERAALAATVAERVVALLLAYGGLADGEVALSQDDIAQQVGSNRRSVVRVMTLLYRSGGLKRVGRRYAIVDRAKLLAAVAPDIPDMVGTADATPWAERA